MALQCNSSEHPQVTYNSASYSPSSSSGSISALLTAVLFWRVMFSPSTIVGHVSDVPEDIDSAVVRSVRTGIGSRVLEESKGVSVLSR